MVIWPCIIITLAASSCSINYIFLTLTLTRVRFPETSVLEKLYVSNPNPNLEKLYISNPTLTLKTYLTLTLTLMQVCSRIDSNQVTAVTRGHIVMQVKRDPRASFPKKRHRASAPSPDNPHLPRAQSQLRFQGIPTRVRVGAWCAFG